MKRFAAVLSATIFMGALLAACGQPTLPSPTPTQFQTSTPSPSPSGGQVSPTSAATPSPSPSQALEPTSTAPAPAEYRDRDDLQFADLTGMVFYFASGAGGWSTEVEILSDGEFEGHYYAQSMGDTGDDYPDGTRYNCAFSGKFSSLKKTGDYEYSMKLESITQEGTPGEAMIEDGWRYIIATPYGFEDADEFKLYLPGKKIDELPEEFVHWVSIPRAIEFESGDVLPFYGLYNVGAEHGFSN